MPRLFAAIPVPPGVAASLSDALPGGLPALRRVAPELLHVTLAFVGQVGEDRVSGVRAALAESVRGVPAFRVAFTGLALFPEHGPPRIVWAATDAGREIERTGAAVRRALDEHRIPFDRKPLRPHVTLARVRDGARATDAAAIAEAVAAARVPEGLAFAADALHLMESVLSRSGPRYSSIARVALVDDGTDGAPGG